VFDLLKIVWYGIPEKILEVVDALRERGVNFLRLVLVAGLVSVVIVGSGFILGRYADATGAEDWARTASVLIVVGSLLCSILFAFVWVLLAAYCHGGWIASRMAARVKSSFAFTDRTEMEGIIRWARTSTAWLSIACLVMIAFHDRDPIWRHPMLVALFIGCALAFAGITQAEWFQRRLGRPVFAVFVVVCFFFTVVRYLSPSFGQLTADLAGRYLGRWEYAQVVEAREAEVVAINRALLDRKLAELNTLKLAGATHCDGHYCPSDEKRAHELEAAISSVRDGENWDAPKEPKQDRASEPVSSPVVSETAVVTGSHQAKAQRPKVKPSAGRTRVCLDGACRQVNLDGVWDGLGRFATK
jgi:hypothetical protein